MDSFVVNALASSAVTVIVSFFKKALDKGIEEFGKSSAGVLFEKLKDRLSHSGSKEALDDLSKDPSDNIAQSALNMQLRKALNADPEFANFLKEWVGESAENNIGISQTASINGDSNKTTQIAGSGNSVS